MSFFRSSSAIVFRDLSALGGSVYKRSRRACISAMHHSSPVASLIGEAQNDGRENFM